MIRRDLPHPAIFVNESTTLSRKRSYELVMNQHANHTSVIRNNIVTIIYAGILADSTHDLTKLKDKKCEEQFILKYNLIYLLQICGINSVGIFCIRLVPGL